jgi:hypothetical protein
VRQDHAVTRLREAVSVSGGTGTAPSRENPAWYRVALSAWRSGAGVLPTTRAGAELAVIITMVGWRAGTVAQIVPAVPDGLSRSTSPALDGVLLGVLLIESTALCTVIIRRRRYASATWASVDTAMGLLVLLTEPAYVPVSDRVGTWTGWAPAVAINVTVGVALGCPGRWQAAGLVTLLAGAYLLVSYPEIGHGASGGTVTSNVVSFFVFALLAAAMAGFVRRFGADADAAREAAITAAKQVELERHRRLLHDPASLLRYLADPDLDPRVAASVRTQAISEANRIRAFLTDSGSQDGSSSTRLVARVRSAAASFSDLPIELLLDLADDVELEPPVADAVQRATETVLHNVRRHAGDGVTATLHADLDPHEGEWELTIRDDGQGFDTTTTRLGFGLTQQVTAALAEVGVSCDIQSEPGVGTTVTMRGTLP